MNSWRRWFAGVIIAAALVGAVLHWGELRNFAELLRRAEPRWLVVAVALQLATYASVAFGWRAVLLRAEGKLYALRPLFRIALCKLFADQALPTAGMGGNVLLVDQLVALGVMRGTAVAALLISLLGFYASYLVFAVTALFLLWLHGDATPLMVGLVTSFVLVAIAIPALALWLRRRGSKPLPAVVESVRPIRQLLETVAQAPAELIRDRRLFLRVMLFNALIFAADVLTLYTCLRALGTEVSLSTSLIAYILAAIAVTLGPIPLGLGSFEVVCTSTLRLLGVPLEAALAGTLLLRVLILWLPLVPGLLLMRTMLRRLGRRPPE
jgi:uncharacterized protein (TIRG00374 family)